MDTCFFSFVCVRNCLEFNVVKTQKFQHFVKVHTTAKDIPAMNYYDPIKRFKLYNT